MKILVTGGKGFIAQHVVRNLVEKDYNVTVPSARGMYDLRNPVHVEDMFWQYKPTHVIHLAANLGGLGYNIANSAQILHDNTVMGLAMLKMAQKYGVEKFVNIGTSFFYPMDAPTPLREESLWQGFPNPATAPYGVSKLLLMLQGQTMRKETGFNAITVIPANVYGPHDTFDDHKSHVIPALIKKAIHAKENNEYLVVWGKGKATREFIYAEDCAEAIVRAMESYDKPEPMNIGTGIETSIMELASIIADSVGLDSKRHIRWDTDKPDGAVGRVFDVHKMVTELVWLPKTTLEEGIMKTIDYYRSTLYGNH